MRRIAVITGTRAEYGLLRSTIAALAVTPRVETHIIATGQHLLPKFGRTIDDIRADGWKIAARVAMQSGDDAPTDQARGLSRGVAGIARFLHDANIDVVVVLGDRIDRPARIERLVMTVLLDTVARAGLRRRIIYPNSDRGHAGVIAAIERHVRNHDHRQVVTHRSLARMDYLHSLIDAACIIGNSSSGIIEAPLAGTATINIGDRQAGREHGGKSIVSCDESETAIETAIGRALRMRPKRGVGGVYGDGRAGRRIAKILGAVQIDRRLVRKLISY